MRRAEVSLCFFRRRKPSFCEALRLKDADRNIPTPNSAQLFLPSLSLLILKALSLTECVVSSSSSPSPSASCILVPIILDVASFSVDVEAVVSCDDPPSVSVFFSVSSDLEVEVTPKPKPTGLPMLPVALNPPNPLRGPPLALAGGGVAKKSEVACVVVGLRDVSESLDVDGTPKVSEDEGLKPPPNGDEDDAGAAAVPNGEWVVVLPKGDAREDDEAPEVATPNGELKGAAAEALGLNVAPFGGGNENPLVGSDVVDFGGGNENGDEAGVADWTPKVLENAGAAGLDRSAAAASAVLRSVSITRLYFL